MTKRNPIHKMLLTCVLLGFWADIFLCGLIYTKITHYSYFKSIFIQALMAQGIDLQMIGEELIQEYFHLMANTTLSLLFIFMLMHVIIYFFLYKQKAFAMRYISLYYATAFLGFIALCLTSIIDLGPIFFSAAVEAALYGTGFVTLRKLSKLLSLKDGESPAKSESH